MKTVGLTDKNAENGCVILLGGFDGLHIGHKRLVARAKEYRLPIGAMTIVGAKSGKSLFTFAEREIAFAENGVDFVVELPFEEIRGFSPAAFLRLLTDKYAPRVFLCGDDFRFGKDAVGTPEMIKTSTRVRVETLELIRIDGEKISTGTVKERLIAGDLAGANALLGEPFFLAGLVEKDRQVGRTIGFPTANIKYPDGKIPLKTGVYETRVCVDGVDYKAITNYGARPTFGDASVWTETYLDGFSGDLYGKTLKVRFVRFLREIRKFENAAALQAQLQEDIRRIRE